MAKSGTDPAAVSLPAGTGFAAGLGESFSLDLNTGQGNYSVPIPLPDGVAGFTPRLKLEYASAYGHGPFGLGWRLPLRELTRRLDPGVPSPAGEPGGADAPNEDGSPAGGEAPRVERFLDGNRELLPMPDGTYRPQLETTFQVYRRSGRGWIITERSGIRHELGLTPAGRVADPDHPDRVQTWLLERSVDTAGNEIRYRYRHDGGTAYLEEVRYAAYAVRLVYGPRPDVRLNGRAGFLRRLALRCQRVELYLVPAGAPEGAPEDTAEGAPERRVRSWDLAYTQDPHTGVSLLESVQLTGHGDAPDGSEDLRKNPVRFRYTGLGPEGVRVRWMSAEAGDPPPLTDPDVALCPLDTAPLPGVLQVINGVQYYWPNRGDLRWGHPVPLRAAPHVHSLGRAGAQIVDLDGNGSPDLLVAAGAGRLHGYYENAGGTRWGRFVHYPRARAAAPPWTSGRLRAGDLDGDGRVDAVYSGSRGFALYYNRAEEGWSDPELALPGPDGPDVDFADPLVHLADMTGDGLLDIVRIRSGRVEYWPSLGHGRFGPRQLLAGSPRLPGITAAPQELLLLDVDGNGCADLVRVSAAGRIEIWFNQGGARFSAPLIRDGIPAPIPGSLRPADMTGSGRPGVVYNSRRFRGTGYVYCELAADAAPHLLTGIDHGTGLISTITYRSAVADALRDRDQAEPWPTYLPFPVQVVASTSEHDVITGRTATTLYQYHAGHFDPRTRQFQGFSRVEKMEQGDESRPHTLTVYHFRMGEDRLPGRGPEHVALNRLLHRVELFGLDGSPDQERPYQVEESEHDFTVLDMLPDGRPRLFVFVRRSRVRYQDRTEDERVEERTYTYDAFGNVTREEFRAAGARDGVAQPEQRLVTEVTYAHSAARGILDRVCRVVKRDGAGRLVGEIRRYYDGPDFQGLPLGQVERGLTTREEQLVLDDASFSAHYAGMDAAALGYTAGADADGRPGWWVQKERYAYNARGLRVGEMDALGHVTTHEWDPTGLFRTARTDSLGTRRLVYDPARGQPVQVTDPDGSQVTMAYDALGRVVQVVLPGDTPDRPTRRYQYDDAATPGAIHVFYRLAAGAPGEMHAVTYFDGAGKEMQKRVGMAPDRVMVSGWLERNPWGQTRAEYEPTFAADFAFAIPDQTGRPQRRFFYDAAGRPVRTRNYNGGESTVTHSPWVLTLADANDNDDSPENVARGQHDTPRREEYDAQHRRVAVVEAGATGPVTTRYELDALGRLLAYHDDNGEVARHTWDLLGNRLTIRHREAGERRLWYDAARRVVRTVDGRGHDVRAGYDAAGRLTQVNLDGTPVEEYTYNAPGTGGWGRLAEVRYPGGRQRFAYTPRGQVASQTWEVEGQPGPWTIAYQYNGLGREIQATYPGGHTVAQEYYENGLLRRIPGFIDEIEYDARSLPVRIRYANGVTTEVGYTPGPGRVARQRTTGPGGEVYADLQYGFDQQQLLTEITDLAAGGPVTRIDYDPLYQITRWSAGDTVHEYQYASPRNLGFLGEQETHLAYDDPARPGLLTGIRRGAHPAFAVPYDGNGNMTALPGRRLTWNFKNELAQVQRDDGLLAEYRYDHRGNRVFKRVQEGNLVNETVFLDDRVEIRDGQVAFYVMAGRSRVALVAGGRTRYIHGDYLGSGRFYTDERGIRIARIAYQPFGNLATAGTGGGAGRGAGADAPGAPGAPGGASGASGGTPDGPPIFALHPFDAESGLYYMGRRYYAPEIGRFLSPDPLYLYQPERDSGDPRTLALYTYVANDPLNQVDPTGTSFWSVVGAIVGVVVGVVVAALTVAAFMTGIGWGILALAGVAALVTVSYVTASATAGSGFGEFMRGFLIGLNAGMNGTFGAVIFGALLGPVGVALGVAVGVLNFLAAFDTVAQSEVYQGILGWSNLLMPMSWLVTGLGLIFFVLNLLGHVVTFGQVPFFEVTDVRVDWKTGTFFTQGGWIANLNPLDTGFNMGNFAFIDRNNPVPMATIVEHEAGHTLNLAAFGSIFHFVGAIDENVLGNGMNAYSEQLAESNVPGTTRPMLPMWV